VTSALPLSWRLRATAAAIVIPPLLRMTSLARLTAWLGAPRRPPRRPLQGPRSQNGLDDASLARWVDRVLGRLPDPWHRTCLRRAAVLYHLLRKAGRPVELCIGVRRNAGGPLAAHAWLVRDGEPYLEAEPHAAAIHTVIARFPEPHNVLAS